MECHEARFWLVTTNDQVNTNLFSSAELDVLSNRKIYITGLPASWSGRTARTCATHVASGATTGRDGVSFITGTMEYQVLPAYENSFLISFLDT